MSTTEAARHRPDAGGVRRLAAHYLSRWVLAGLAADLAIAIADIAIGGSLILTTAFLVTPLALALVETASRVAVVAAVSWLLAVASGAWHDYFLTTDHLYRLLIVGCAAVLSVTVARLRWRALTARDRMELLAEVAGIADARGPLEHALERLAELLVPAVADLCEIVLLDDGEPRRVATRVEPELDPALMERLSERPISGPGAAPSQRARYVAEPVLTADLASRRFDDAVEGAHDLELLASLGMRSAIHAPMQAAGKTLALMTLAVGPSRRRYGAEDLRFARTVATRAALAIENARLFREIAEAEERLQTVVGSLAEAITIRDLDDRIVYANDAALAQMGFESLEELRERPARALLDDYVVTDEHGGALEMEDIPSVRLLRGEQPGPLLMRSVHRGTGEERWALLKATALRDSEGRLEAAVTVIEDVTAAKRAEAQTSFLSRVSEVLASSLDYEQTLRNVAWLAVPEIADWCAVDLIDDNGQRQQVVIAHPDPAKLELAKRLREWDPQQLDPSQGIGAVFRSGRSELWPEIPDELLEQGARSPEHLALLREVGMRSVLIVPVRAGTRTLGAMTLVSAESGRRFGDEDRVFAEQVAARAGVAVENARLYTQRSQIAATLQRSLLPDALPDIPGWEIAALYRPAQSHDQVEVGGDFYDAFQSEHGWLVLIGDVTGKGVEAAAMTSLVRHGARFVGEERPEPDYVLARLDAALRQQPSMSLCSALCLLIDGERIQFSSAGHPLPLIVTDDGVRDVGSTGPVLGAFADGEWPTYEITLGRNEALLLYTDGVTDTVGADGRFGEQRLRQTMAECGPDEVEQLLNCLDVALGKFEVGAQADDTAALALRLVPVPARRASATHDRHSV